jgi:hypothetical protein
MDPRPADLISLLAALEEPPKLTDPRLGGIYDVHAVYGAMSAAGAASYPDFPGPREPLTNEGLRRLWEIAKRMQADAS